MPIEAAFATVCVHVMSLLQDLKSTSNITCTEVAMQPHPPPSRAPTKCEKAVTQESHDVPHGVSTGRK
jgi:hypothetical protein